MIAKLVRIGNSKGVRIPQGLLEKYRVKEGETVELEARREGILVRPLPQNKAKMSWAASYQAMAEEAAERAEWSEWDAVAVDGFDD